MLSDEQLFFVDGLNINLFETCAIGNKYLNSLKFYGCYQSEKEPTRVTPTSKSLLDHIVHDDCQSNLEFEVIKTIIADHYATYVLLEKTRSQSIRFQQTRATMPFLRNYLRHSLELSNLEQDVKMLTESQVDALT